MALAGKVVGKAVGMWFGPSTAAGAVRMLVEAFPAYGMGGVGGFEEEDQGSAPHDLRHPRRATNVARRGRRRDGAGEHLGPGGRGSGRGRRRRLERVARAVVQRLARRGVDVLIHARASQLQLNHTLGVDEQQWGRAQREGGHGGGSPRSHYAAPWRALRSELGPPSPAKDKGKGTVGDAYAELEGGDGFIDVGGEVEIEDDWVDPVTRPPAPAPNKGSKAKGKSKKAVLVPSVHYPFTVSAEDGAGAGADVAAGEREGKGAECNGLAAAAGANAGGQRVHTARARDGGRTQSGGVRGVLTEDS